MARIGEGPGAVRALTVVCASAALAAAASCRAPTEVTIVLTTDVPCGKLKEISISVGTAAAIETKSPVAVTSTCNPVAGGDSSIGTFVVIPDSGEDSAPFAVRVVAAVDKMTAADCTSADGYSGCIVARRELAFIPHTPLTLPIAMRFDCLDVACIPGETCVQKECRSAQVDPNLCARSCGEETLAPIDAGAEGSASDAPASDTSSSVATAQPDATTPDATLADAAPSPDTGAPDDASPHPDGSPPGDASVLGPCVSSGTSAGVACASGACAAGQVCCIAAPSGGTPAESCTAPAACNVDAGGAVSFSPLACRSVGDCPSGSVCCLKPSLVVGGGVYTTCTAASACTGISYRPACQNSCECPGSYACMTATCSGLPVGLCGSSVCF